MNRQTILVFVLLKRVLNGWTKCGVSATRVPPRLPKEQSTDTWCKRATSERRETPNTAQGAIPFVEGAQGRRVPWAGGKGEAAGSSGWVLGVCGGG